MTTNQSTGTPRKIQCGGSYSDAVMVFNVHHGAKRVTGECPVCGRRVSFVGVETMRDGVYVGKQDRVLGRHDLPKTK